MLQKPQPGEYYPFYETYIQHLPDQANVIELLQKQQQEVVQLFGRVSENEANFAYAPGKWTVKELLGHMNDTERIMTYRLLCVARGDKNPLPGFEENEYVLNANFGERTLSGLLEEHQVVRAASPIKHFAL